jgi:hypothetical protein
MTFHGSHGRASFEFVTILSRSLQGERMDRA